MGLLPNGWVLKMEKIKAAAWGTKEEGKIVGVGKNHEEAIINTSYYPDKMEDIEPGFITTTGRFVNRQYAAKIAFKAEQIDEIDDGGLVSEELWLWRNPPYQYCDEKGYYLKDENNRKFM